jgi:hypothetical protein
MKIYKSNYRNHWVSPYTILETVCFWEKDRDCIYDHDDDAKNPYRWWVNFLTPICRVWSWFLDLVHPQINYVKIDRWDSWNMDSTLADIVLPLLKQLKLKKHGAPCVDDEDVPEHLQSTAAPPKENEYDIDAYHFQRWDWIMDEMIHAFECKANQDWTDKYYTGTADYQFKKLDETRFNPITNKQEGLSELVEGPKHTQVVDWDGMKAEQARITNGFRLFGKYYEGLWD